MQFTKSTTRSTSVAVYAFLLSALLISAVLPVYRPHRLHDISRLWQSPPRTNQPCSLYDQASCGAGQCCVKEVISYQDLDKNPVVRTLCQPHLAEGELCLRQPEGYLCDCAKGLFCRFVHNETYGHCGPG